SNTHDYYIVYENINGLAISSPVKLNGMQVGRVNDISILQDQGNKLKVYVTIRSDLKLGNKTTATLSDDGLLGGKVILLDVGPVDQVLASGSELEANEEAGLLSSLTEKADPLIAKADSIFGHLEGITRTLNNSRENITKIFDNLTSTSTNLAQALDANALRKVQADLSIFSSDLVKLEKKFDPMVSRLDTFSTQLADMDLNKSLNEANKALTNLNDVLDKINKGEGTLGALANNDSLYNNLNGLTENLDKLSVDFRENPKRYVQLSVFGRKEKDKDKKGGGEK
ncbi:MAG: MlaD family protein, partial [Bacteroidota bacterium]